DSLQRYLHSFPTRRLSDLGWTTRSPKRRAKASCSASVRNWPRKNSTLCRSTAWCTSANCSSVRSPHPRRRDDYRLAELRNDILRSEEHTSELQSRENIVCR